MAKTTLKLRTGQIIDCGVKEKEELHKSIKNQDSKEIAINSFKLLGSSETLMKELTDSLFQALKDYEKEINKEQTKGD